jgi:hypothetical protein
MMANTEESLDFSWLTDLVNALPATTKRRKNIIEIAGCRNKESVNSNLLAFYLDKNEEHGLSRLFFESLLDLIEQKTDNDFERNKFDGDIKVEREVEVETGQVIDILIKEDSGEGGSQTTGALNADEEQLGNEDWAIIIENKVHADLNNDLRAYWEGTKKSNKVGIVLALSSYQESEKLKNEAFDFYGITHKELVKQVKQNLPDYYIEADDRHLLFLKEYISQIESFYQEEQNQPAMDKKLQKFHEYANNIKIIKQNENELREYLCNCIYDKMEREGFPPKDRKPNNAMHYYADEETIKQLGFSHEIAKMFRFWVPIENLLADKKFEAFFELFDRENTVYRNSFIERLRDIFTENVLRDDEGKHGGLYYHIYKITFTLQESFEKESFESQLNKNLDEHFFRHPNNFLGRAFSELEKVINDG